MQKNFIVNNNNKIIRACYLLSVTCYLSSTCPVCRSIVNLTTGGTSRIKLSTLLKINIFNYIVPYFSKKSLKYTCNIGILSIQIMGKCIFVLFRNFLPFNWRANLVIYLFFLFCLTKQLGYATYGLETCC